MGIVRIFEHTGMDGGTWYAASYPLGATRYYSTPQARTEAVTAYCDAITRTGGHVLTVQA